MKENWLYINYYQLELFQQGYNLVNLNHIFFKIKDLTRLIIDLTKNLD